MTTTIQGRWLLLGAALVLASPATTQAQRHDFLLHPVDRPVAVFAEEFDHAVGARLIDTAAPTTGKPPTPWMGSDTFIIAEDSRFGTGNVATRSGIPGDHSGDGRTDQVDLDLVLANWGDGDTMVPFHWINDLPSGNIDQTELDAVLAHWGDGDAGQLACLPWEVDPNEDEFYSVQAQVWMPEKSSNPNVTNSVGVGFLDNEDVSQSSFADGRSPLWIELYYTDEQAEGEHDAHYRVRGKDTSGTVELFDSATSGKTVDLSEGFATLEIAWKSSSQLNWRMYGAAVVDALGQTDLIHATPNGMINGPLMNFDNQGAFNVDGVGFEMAGSGGMIGGFHAVPEPATIALLGIGSLMLAAAVRRRRQAA